MFVVLLKFSGNRHHASQFLEGHKEWLRRGFADGVFLVAGGLKDGTGGGIVAHASSLPDLKGRIDADPFVAHGIVNAEIIELAPSAADPRLNFLLA